MKFIFFGLCLILTSNAITANEVYTWKDENGKTVYSDKPRDKKSEKVAIQSVNIADPVDVVERPPTPQQSSEREYQPEPYQPTAREQQLAKEQEDNEKCLRYYGYPCKAVSHYQEQNQNNNSSGGVRTRDRPRISGDRGGRMGAERRQRYGNQR